LEVPLREEGFKFVSLDGTEPEEAGSGDPGVPERCTWQPKRDAVITKFIVKDSIKGNMVRILSASPARGRRHA
jgi:hypothetical protein